MGPTKSNLDFNQTFAFFFEKRNSHQGILFKSLKKGHLYFKSKRYALHLNKFEDYGKDVLNKSIDHSIDLGLNNKRVLLFFYEYHDEKVGSDTPICLDLEFEHKVKHTLSIENNDFKMKLFSKIKKSDYEKKFSHIKEEILDGFTYQVNLTSNFKFQIDYKNKLDCLSLFRKKKNISTYAHIINLAELNQTILSNSPECLINGEVKGERVEVYSLPIKGTQALTGDIKKDIKRLNSSTKEQAELFMIADLLRNDLSSIDQPSAEVIYKKRFFKVPKLLHQYSVIKNSINKNISLLTIIQKMFPGGSITGAPKKSTINIISKVEDGPRGIYCGSTFIFNQSSFSSSINIRSAQINWDKDELVYGAGGGITIQSNLDDEYTEMLDKVDSFSHLFDISN